MYTAQSIELARRKERLIAQIAQQRVTVLAGFSMLKKPLALADKTAAAGRYAAAHPLLVAAVAAIFMVLGRRSLLTWAGRLWGGWRLWRFVRNWLRTSDLLK